MAQGYYTLTEAAQLLAMPVDELKQMAQKGQIRSFQDRGTLRFREQDIQELARKRGVSSDPELVLGDASLSGPKSSATPSAVKKKSAASPKTPAKQEGAPEVFEFDFDGDSVDLGADVPIPTSGAKSKPGSKSGKKVATPQVGSDSDVRLVADGSDVTFSVPKDPAPAKPPDSDVKISPDPLKPKTGLHGAPSSGKKRSSQLAIGSDPKAKMQAASSGTKLASPKPGSGPLPMDSGVRLVPIDDDSDVKLLGDSDDVPLGAPGELSDTDSNVRLEKVPLPPADSGEGSLLLTEEINLDEEILKQQEKEKDQPATKLKAKSELKFPSSSPFELSDSDLEMPAELKDGAGPKTPTRGEAEEGADSSDFDLAAQKEEGSSDFDLVPAEDGSILLEGESKDFSLEVADDSEQVVADDDANTELTSSTSGLSLNNPADAGISLEESQDSSDFDLSLEPEDTPKPQKSQPIGDDSDSEFELTTEKTPKPAKKKPKAVEEEPSDSSEFELSLDSDADQPAVAEEKDDSNFEINLDGSGEGEAGAEDSSEFELTLDDSGNLAAVDEEAAAPQVKSRKKKKGAAGEEQDIFDTDFEVPALDESDEATVADSELESSDFDLALDDSDLASEEESGSQVVALDEEDAATVADDDAAVVDDVDVEEESSDFADLDEDVEVEDVDAEDVEVETEKATKVRTETVIQEKLIPPAQWGILPVIFMLPCVIIMFLVGLLGFEVVQSSGGMKPPGPLTIAIADTLGTSVTLTPKKN